MDWTQDSSAYSSAPASRDPLLRVCPSPRPIKEETSCGSGSIFRVRWCNKKQSSQRGVDRRWRGRPRLVRRVDDRLSALDRATPVSLFIPGCSRPPFIGIICLIGICISKFAESFFPWKFFMRIHANAIFYLRDCYVWCFNYSVFAIIIYIYSWFKYI